MKTERRDYQRLKTNNLKAGIQPIHSDKEEIDINAEIVDISRTGIRIRLKNPLQKNINDKLKITMPLPKSGNPFTVHGTLKHLHNDTEYGIHYTDHVEGSIDDILFECIQLNDSTLLIKSLL